MARTTTLLALALAAVPYVLLSFEDQQKLTPTQSQTAAKAMTLLKAHCASCHSGSSPSAGLDLTTPEGLDKGGMSGKLFVPGNATASLLMKRVRGTPGLERMPMGFAPLNDEELGVLASWIDSGAPTRVSAPHWAYQRVVRPAVPATDAKWVRNPIDAFVLARLKKEGLRPSPEASKETLIRRVSLDLIGLPPTVAEVDAFLADEKTGAYERLVDRLLASRHYGERQARPWLDLARYADSDGYEKDLKRTAWKWRDWIIDAYNQNMTFDKFTVEQLAGDLLPNPTLNDLVATGFQRNTMQNLEGGVDQEEAHFLVVLDRVSTTGTVWLGTTIGCARCHDHKYDPFTQKDFYRLAAFYSNSQVLPEGPKESGEEKWLEKTIEVPTPAQLAKKVKLKQQITVLQRKAANWTPALRKEFQDWRATVLGVSAWTALRPAAVSASSGAPLTLGDDSSVLAGGKIPERETYKLTLPGQARTITGIRIEALTDPSLPKMGPGRSDNNGNLVITNVKLTVSGKAVKLTNPVADHSQTNYPPQNALLGNPNTGWAIAGGIGKPHELIFELEKPASGPIELAIEQQSIYDQHVLGKFRVSVTDVPAPAATLLPPDIRAILQFAQRTPKDDTRLEKHFLSITPTLRSERDKLMAAQKELSDLQSQIPTALIMRDKPNPGPLTAYLRTRGEFLSKAEVVRAGTPAILPPMPNKDRVNRLDLAKWLVSKENPLTARVQMNRMWEQYFGRGIVETTENLGTQCSPPSHPELLDWLASEFMRRNWDMKAMHRLIVTSATYRQSSNATPVLIAKDPQNILLARGPRFRMEAELIRDTVLKASGLLDEKIGGPSVYPYQPEGVWDTPYNGQSWMYKDAPDAYRRGIYTFVKRTSPYPSMIAFDATSREECTVRRIRTNTPLQALEMLNDQAVFVGAKALGGKMAELASGKPMRLGRTGAPPVTAALVYGFRCCTSRTPSSKEVARLESLYSRLLTRYRKDEPASKKIAPTAEQAAWTMVANVLLNLDETITKD